MKRIETVEDARDCGREIGRNILILADLYPDVFKDPPPTRDAFLDELPQDRCNYVLSLATIMAYEPAK